MTSDEARPPGAERDPTQAVVWLDARQDEVWRLLLTVQSQMMERLDEEMRRSHDLSLADYDVLVALSENAGGLRMSELAQRVMLSPSGLTRRVDRLVTRHLVDRQACPSDGRGSLAVLTAGGRRQLRQAAPTHVSGVRRYLMDPVTPAGIEQLASGLRAVNRALDDAAPPHERRDRGQPGSGPVTVGWPAAAHPLVPPATETAE